MNAPKPGFLDTFRAGWNVPSLKLAGGKAVEKGAAAKGVGPGAKPKGDGAKGDGERIVAGQPVTRPELAKQRDALARQFAELQWDLGGIAYEMASRDHFRMDVLLKQAAKLQEVDAQLGQVERVLRLDQEGAAGTCPACGALQARGAVFCWQCGKELRPEAKKEAKDGEKKPAEAKPAEAKPAEAKPAEAKPAEAKPPEARTAELKPDEAKPAEAKTDEVNRVEAER
jgi:uncharacterized Zn finger protein (UPF0148 family)